MPPPPPPPPVGLLVGLGDGDGDCVMIGGILCVLVTVGVGAGSVGEVVGDVDAVGVAEAVGDGLIACPTCAGGGKLSTGLPASAAVIICCHVDAGKPPPYNGLPLVVTW